jgi:hypothetical protein
MKKARSGDRRSKLEELIGEPVGEIALEEDEDLTNAGFSEGVLDEDGGITTELDIPDALTEVDDFSAGPDLNDLSALINGRYRLMAQGDLKSCLR